MPTAGGDCEKGLSMIIKVLGKWRSLRCVVLSESMVVLLLYIREGVAWYKERNRVPQLYTVYSGKLSREKKRSCFGTKREFHGENLPPAYTQRILLNFAEKTFADGSETAKNAKESFGIHVHATRVANAQSIYSSHDQ